MKKYTLKKALNQSKYPYQYEFKHITEKFNPSGKVDKFMPSIGLEDKSHKKINFRMGVLLDVIINDCIYYLPVYLKNSFNIKHKDSQLSFDFLKNIRHNFSQKNDKCYLERNITVKSGKETIKLKKNQEIYDLIVKHINNVRAVWNGPKLEKTIIINGAKIKVSSKPYDILTMSMRGIDSCMSWSWDGDVSENCRSLVGSMYDPYCSIIYITDGKKTQYGENMIARSVIRYIKDFNKNQDGVLIENVYLNEDFKNQSYGYDRNYIINLFKDFIKEKTNIKNIIYYNEYKDTYVVPRSDLYEKIANISNADHYHRVYDNRYSSYSDVGVFREVA